jgi:hypothetical protein
MSKKRTNADLRKMCDQVLCYELVELRRGAHYLRTMLAGGHAGAGPWNLILEGFVTHFRNLREFLFNHGSDAKNRVTAKLHFFENWDVQPSGVLERRRYGQACQQVSHITWDRVDLASDAKQWPFTDIVREIEAVLLQFIQATPKEKIGETFCHLLVGSGCSAPAAARPNITGTTATPTTGSTNVTRGASPLCGTTSAPGNGASALEL